MSRASLRALALVFGAAVALGGCYDLASLSNRLGDLSASPDLADTLPDLAPSDGGGVIGPDGLIPPSDGLLASPDFSACTPVSCVQANRNCDPWMSCSSTMSCGSCPSGLTCGGGNVPGVCGPIKRAQAPSPTVLSG